MELKGWYGRFYTLAEWAMRLVYLNLLWIAFSLLGMVVFGFMPATTAMFAIERQWITNQPDCPIFRTFWTTYKREFFSSNALALFLAVIGLVLYLDTMFFRTGSNVPMQLMKYFTFGLWLLYGMTLAYLLPVFVTYDMPLMHAIKVALLLGVSHPLRTVLMGAMVAPIVLIAVVFPIFDALFIGSTTSFLITWNAVRLFRRGDKRLLPESSLTTT